MTSFTIAIAKNPGIITKFLNLLKYLTMPEKAVKAWYENHQICIMLEDEREIRFPVQKNRILQNASVEEISNIEIISGGTGLHWPLLDED